MRLDTCPTLARHLQTKINEWQPPHRFVDVQVGGPYHLWHHTHTFEANNGGTMCRDHVRYRPIGGALVNWLFVRRDVEHIFQFRQELLKDLFNSGRKVSGMGQPAKS